MPQLAQSFQDRLGKKLLCINPDGAYAELGCSPANVNIYEPIVDAVWSDDPKTRALTGMFLHDINTIATPSVNDKTSGGSAFFINGGRDCGSVIRTYLALTEPEVATPAYEYRILSDVHHAKDTLRLAAHDSHDHQSDPIVNDMRRKAASILEIISEKPEYFPQFLKVPLDGLKCFEESGNLGSMGEFAAARLSDLRTKPDMVVGLMTPLHLLDHYKKFISLATYAVFSSVMVHRDGIPIRFVLDEFVALKIPSFDTKLNTLRGLGCSVELYIQNKSGVIKNYDQHTTDQIYANCDIKQFSGLSHKEAKDVSDMLGKKTVRVESASIKGQFYNDVSSNVSDKDVPIMSAQDIMSMPKDEQLILISGLPPIKAKKIPYWDVDGLKQLVADNPLEGPSPETKPKAGLKITKAGVKLRWPKSSQRWSLRQYLPRIQTMPVTWQSFIWLYAWIAIALAFQSSAYAGTLPALLVDYTYRQVGSTRSYIACNYIALNGRRFTTFNGDCPLIILSHLGNRS